jgi:signal transduction histidine kinase
MSSGQVRKIWNTVGFRLTLRYAAFFALSYFLLFAFAYYHLSSVAQGFDRDSIELEMKELLSEYEKGGVEALAREANFEAHVAGKRVYFIRLAGPGNKNLFLSIPDQWKSFNLKELEAGYKRPNDKWIHLAIGKELLEIATQPLPGGNLLQVGKSMARRGELLSRFPVRFTWIVVPVVFICLAGGALLTFRALRPIKGLIGTMQSIIATGQLNIELPTRQTADELDELVVLFNGMMKKISILVGSLKGTLDNAAHDLRTPLTRLRGMAERALQPGQNARRMREALVACIEESDHILRILNTLMDITEAETGVMKLNIEEANVSSLIEDTVELYRFAAEEKEISVVITCPKDLSTSLDPARIRQVLANLLDNAIKYTPEMGHVSVDADSNVTGIRISVRDTGAGIAPEDLSRIWDRLFRGDQSRSKRGLGLGLSLVKAIVEAHNGSVAVSSEPGVGSVFSICIPERTSSGS